MNTQLKEVIKSGDFIVLDTETTGLGSDAEICQIAIIDSGGNVLLDALVKPTKPIPDEAIKIHGITNELVQNALSWELLAPAVNQLVCNRNLIIYNAEYDTRLIYQSTARCTPNAEITMEFRGVHCAMLAFAEIFGDWNDYRKNYRWQKLTTAADYYKVPVVDAHTALGDCQMTLAVCKAMVAADEPTIHPRLGFNVTTGQIE